MNRRQWRVLRSNKTALLGGGIVLFFALVAIFADLIATHDPELRQPDLLSPPNSEYILGTDPNGFDVFSRLVYGTRSSLLTALAAVGLALLVGLPLGLVAGWRGGWIDSVIMRCVDVMLAFPAVLLAVAIAAALGEPSLTTVVIAVAVVLVPPFIRQVRAAVIQVKSLDYVTAARALGVPPARIVFRTVLPNCIAPILVVATLGIGIAILDAAGLSFLGLGPPETSPEWGVMLQKAMRYVQGKEQWIVLPPGIAISLTVLGFNLFGDGLRDAYDPRQSR